MLFPSFKEGRVRIEFPCMENNLLFFHFIEEEEQDILSFGYLLYSPSFSLISSGKKTNPHDILDLIEENIPICYDLLYFSTDILSLYEKDGRSIDWDKKYFDLYALYKYKRHLHFYVDIFDCLTHLGLFHKTVDSNFDVEDADAKDMARLSRVIFEDFSLKYDGSSTGVLNGRLGWSDLRRQKKRPRNRRPSLRRRKKKRRRSQYEAKISDAYSGTDRNVPYGYYNCIFCFIRNDCYNR